MLQNAMRYAGFSNWTVGTHSNHKLSKANDWDEGNLNVSEMRTPRITHPQGGIKGSAGNKNNVVAPSIDFRDLARHVKQHPKGDDALDLTRCVNYAISHPDETWKFPDDFERLVTHLGGPQEVKLSHYDREIFRRYTFTRTRSRRNHNPQPSTNTTSTKESMVSTRRLTTLRSEDLRPMVQPSNVSASVDSPRRSGRIAVKITKNMYEASESEDTEGAGHLKRKRTRTAALDGDFDGSGTSLDSSGTELEDVSDGDLFQPPKRRRAMDDALDKMKEQIIQEEPRHASKTPPKAQSEPLSPTIQGLFGDFMRDRYKQPVTFLKPPVLSRDRLVVDELSIWLYAEEGASDLWASALSSTRFNGPRKSPPFRELYRLTEPDPMDVSDWAENIRWAKEQRQYYGSTTWTEYDYHLEQITEHRMKTCWVSEECIRAGMKFKKS